MKPGETSQDETGRGRIIDVLADRRLMLKTVILASEGSVGVCRDTERVLCGTLRETEKENACDGGRNTEQDA